MGKREAENGPIPNSELVTTLRRENGQMRAELDYLRGLEQSRRELAEMRAAWSDVHRRFVQDRKKKAEQIELASVGYSVGRWQPELPGVQTHGQAAKLSEAEK